MNSSASERFSARAKLATLLGTASFFAMANAGDAHAQGEMVAQAEEIPETVLITGSLIRGTAAVGVPVTNFSPQDFAMTGALHHRRPVPDLPGRQRRARPGRDQFGRQYRTRHQGQHPRPRHRHGDAFAADDRRHALPRPRQRPVRVDPSIIPALSMDHIDVLVDGASATYGSDAVGGVINIILKRNMDGAITQARWTTAEGGKNRYLASAVWGRTWDGGQITLSYEWYNESADHGELPLPVRPGPSRPGASTTGGRSAPPSGDPLDRRARPDPGGGQCRHRRNLGHGCTNCYAVPLGTGQNWDPGASGIGPTAPSSASTFDWSSFNTPGNSGTNGLRNQFDPYDIAWYDARQERNGGHITVDQRLTSNISFYGSGFYSNRRGHFLNPSNLSPAANNMLFNVARSNLQSLLSDRRRADQSARQLQYRRGKARASPRSMNWPSAINWA